MQLFQNDRVHISISDRVIRYLVAGKKSPDSIQDYGEITLDPLIFEDGKIINHDQLHFILKHLIDEKKWKRKQVAFCVPDSFVTMRTEKVPKQLTKDEAKDFIKLELEGSIRLPFKEPVIDFEPVAYGEEMTDILLFAYPKERFDPLVELFDSLSLQPRVADISYLSVYRSYLASDQHGQTEHVLVIQWNKVDLVLSVFHEHKPKFNRHIHFNSSFQAWKKDEESNKIVWNQSEEALADFIDEQLLTIERFIDFYQYSVMDGNAQVTDVLLVGDFLDGTELKQTLATRFELPIKSITLPNQLPGEYAALYGLTVKGTKFDID